MVLTDEGGIKQIYGAQWFSGRVLDSRRRGPDLILTGALSKNINPSLVLGQPRKTRPFITERLLMGHEIKSNKQFKTVIPC